VYFKLGKPSAESLHFSVPPDAYGRRPNRNILFKWINSDEWKDRIHNLDEMVSAELNGRLVQEKVKMLEEHTKIAGRMQEIGLDYLESHAGELTSATAIKLLTEGIRIERESRGIPDALRKMTELSDEALKKRIQDIYSRSPVVEIMPIEEVEEKIEAELDLEFENAEE
jgi:hypothetical protein